MMAVDNINPGTSLSDVLNFNNERNPGSKHKKSTIHSGSFMVSRVHDVNNEDEEDDENSTSYDDDVKGFDFINANKETSRTYNFGEGSQSIIENSLTKLFECMTLAYR